jgi:hypothetical protein
MTDDAKSRRLWSLRWLVLGLMSLALLVPAGAGATTLSYTFDANDQGWRVSQGDPTLVPPTFSATGGNPGGYVSTVDTGAETGCPPPGPSCDLVLWFGPDLTGGLAANYGGTFSLDYNTDLGPDFVLSLRIPVGAGDDLRVDIPYIGTGWQHISVPLVESSWTYCISAPPGCGPPTEAEFRGALASAIRLLILGDVVDGTGETYGLDNVILTDIHRPVPPPPVGVPSPTAVLSRLPHHCKKHKSKTHKKKCGKKKRK